MAVVCPQSCISVVKNSVCHQEWHSWWHTWHLTNDTWQMTLLVTYTICQVSFVKCHVCHKCHLSSVICHFICQVSFVKCNVCHKCHLSSVICQVSCMSLLRRRYDTFERNRRKSAADTSWIFDTRNANVSVWHQSCIFHECGYVYVVSPAWR